MIFRKCPMSWIFSLAVISLTEGISYGQDQCPEENRNRFLKFFNIFEVRIFNFFLLISVKKIVKSSRWRQNLDTYIKEMEELSKRKPGYKATMNTYAPCRPIMENLQCVRNKLKYFRDHK